MYACMYVYIYIYICMYVYMYVCVCIYIYIYTHIHTHIYSILMVHLMRKGRFCVQDRLAYTISICLSHCTKLTIMINIDKP